MSRGKSKPDTAIVYISCTACGKRSYGSKSAAKKALRQKQAQHTDVSGIYRCPETGDWHMTSQSGEVKRAWDQYLQSR